MFGKIASLFGKNDEISKSENGDNASIVNDKSPSKKVASEPKSPIKSPKTLRPSAQEQRRASLSSAVSGENGSSTKGDDGLIDFPKPSGRRKSQTKQGTPEKFKPTALTSFRAANNRPKFQLRNTVSGLETGDNKDSGNTWRNNDSRSAPTGTQTGGAGLLGDYGRASDSVTTSWRSRPNGTSGTFQQGKRSSLSPEPRDSSRNFSRSPVLSGQPSTSSILGEGPKDQELRPSFSSLDGGRQSTSKLPYNRQQSLLGEGPAPGLLGEAPSAKGSGKGMPRFSSNQPASFNRASSILGEAPGPRESTATIPDLLKMAQNTNGPEAGLSRTSSQRAPMERSTCPDIALMTKFNRMSIESVGILGAAPNPSRSSAETFKPSRSSAESCKPSRSSAESFQAVRLSVPEGDFSRDSCSSIGILGECPGSARESTSSILGSPPNTPPLSARTSTNSLLNMGGKGDNMTRTSTTVSGRFSSNYTDQSPNVPWSRDSSSTMPVVREGVVLKGGVSTPPRSRSPVAPRESSSGGPSGPDNSIGFRRQRTDQLTLVESCA